MGNFHGLENRLESFSKPWMARCAPWKTSLPSEFFMDGFTVGRDSVAQQQGGQREVDGDGRDVRQRERDGAGGHAQVEA